ncbi:MAG: hypothetical protein IJ390_11430 [Lachnospiraceae bacterium]|nr:hypothetical protein [Lachnospiraceae bacterium]
MKKKSTLPLQTGLSLLLVVFIILSLVTFAVLSYVSARRDLSDAQQTADRTSLYYEADLSARITLSKIDQTLSQIYDGLPQKAEAAFLSECRNAFPQMQDNHLTFIEKMGDAQILQAVLTIQMPKDASGSFYRIEKWQIVTAEHWNADDSLPVFSSED